MKIVSVFILVLTPLFVFNQTRDSITLEEPKQVEIPVLDESLIVAIKSDIETAQKLQEELKHEMKLSRAENEKLANLIINELED